MFHSCISRANIDRKMLPIKLVVNGALSKVDLPAWLIHPFKYSNQSIQLKLAKNAFFKINLATLSSL